MLIYVLLIALIVTAIAFILGIVFGYAKQRKYRRYLNIGLVVCAVLAAFCITLGCIHANDVKTVKAEYDTIMLYNDLVDACDDEEVRFGHYERICAYNEKYTEIEEASMSFWFGNLFPKDWKDTIKYVDFNFRGSSYVGG